MKDTLRHQIDRDLVMNDYQRFMDEYNRMHCACPECGSLNNVQTLVAYMLDLSNKEQYRDRNVCECCNCNWSGIVHDLTTRK